jgi:hypothetical protein
MDNVSQKRRHPPCQLATGSLKLRDTFTQQRPKATSRRLSFWMQSFRTSHGIRWLLGCGPSRYSRRPTLAPNPCLSISASEPSIWPNSPWSTNRQVIFFTGSGHIPILEGRLVADQHAPANAIVLWVLALAHFAADDLRAALDRIDAALMRAVTMPDFYLTRAAVLAELNRTEEAQSILARLRSRHTGVSISKIRIPPYKQAHSRERYVSALRRAGLS